MIIDAHSHLLANWVDCQEPKTSIDQISEFDMSAFDKAVEDNEIEYVVTLAQEMTRIHRKWLGTNALVSDFQHNRPDKVIAMAGAEPLDIHDCLNQPRLDEVRESIVKNGLQGLLLTPPYGHYYSNDPSCYPFYSLCQELKVPVYMHHSAQTGLRFLAPLKYARVWLVDEIAANFDGLTILIEHMGWPWTQELFAIMVHCKNVWTDISYLSCRPNLLAWNLTMAREYELLDRVVWGTDYVGDNVTEWADRVKSEVKFLRNDLNQILKSSGWPELSDKELDNILYGNARRLLKLSQ